MTKLGNRLILSAVEARLWARNRGNIKMPKLKVSRTVYSMMQRSLARQRVTAKKHTETLSDMEKLLKSVDVVDLPRGRKPKVKKPKTIKR